MFPTPRQAARTREQTLNNLHSLSSACLDSSQRLTELLSESSRNSLRQSSKNLAIFNLRDLASLSETSRIFWQESTLSPQFIDQVYQIIAATHKAMIEASEAQIEVLDEILFARIDQATHYSLWEAEIGFSALRGALQSAEQTLHQVSDAGIESLSLSEQEMHQVAEILAAEPKPKSKSRSKAKAVQSPAPAAG